MITPAAGYVLVEQYEEKMEGIFVPGEAGNLIGRILAIGAEGLHSSGERIGLGKVAAGDLVVYRKYTDQAVRWQNKEYKLISFEAIVGFIEED